MSSSLLRSLNALGVLGIAVILATGLALQVIDDELPCPLCLLQRVGFTLVMFGFMLNVMQGLRARHYGIVVFAALFGAAVALRQISLHVVPGTGTYGSPILGLHLYTWAFLLFAAVLLAVGVLMIASRDHPVDDRAVASGAQRAVCWFAIAVTAANVIATFLECGPTVCADNPVDYILLSQNDLPDLTYFS